MMRTKTLRLLTASYAVGIFGNRHRSYADKSDSASVNASRPSYKVDITGLPKEYVADKLVRNLLGGRGEEVIKESSKMKHNRYLQVGHLSLDLSGDNIDGSAYDRAKDLYQEDFKYSILDNAQECVNKVKLRVEQEECVNDTLKQALRVELFVEEHYELHPYDYSESNEEHTRTHMFLFLNVAQRFSSTKRSLCVDVDLDAHTIAEIAQFFSHPIKKNEFLSGVEYRTNKTL